MPLTAEAAFRPERWLPIGFSIVGVQKAATSTFFDMLEQHVQVARGPFKEMQFFNTDELDWEHPDYRDYKAGRRAGREIIAGDATPLYIFWPHALERMHAYNPDMRLIAIFRDPIERLFSHWTMQRGRWGRKALDWPDAITRFRPETLPREVPKGVPRQLYASRSGVARGYYGQQLERGFEVYDPSAWLLLEFRTLLADHHTALDQATDHLGLRRYRDYPELPQMTKSPPSIVGTAPTAADIEGLVELYAPDLELFRKLSGLDVGHWPTSRLVAGTMRPEELAATFAKKVQAPAP